MCVKTVMTLVLRAKLSARFSACVEDRRCQQDCGHHYREVSSSFLKL